MKLNEILFLIFWLFLGLFINHQIVNEGPKIDVNIGDVIRPAVQTVVADIESINVEYKGATQAEPNNKGRDGNAS
jgi:hypothetical protein